MSRVVFHPGYDFRCLGLERLHPFDARKYSRAARLLRPDLPAEAWVRPARPASDDELRQVHTAGWVAGLGDPRAIAQALELPWLALLPRWLVARQVLRPVRWAASGTVQAAREALTHGLAVNLGGGYHHARPDGGEGFCLVNDVALAVHTLRAEGRLGADEQVLYIDVDAHQGNGVSHAFLHDRRLRSFDAFNRAIYPHDPAARARIDWPLPLAPGCADPHYLSALARELPAFLDDAARRGPVGLAIVNAGTDVFERDPLGGLALSAGGILARDTRVVARLRERAIPTVFLLSGGYTRESHRLVAASVVALLSPQIAVPA